MGTINITVSREKITPKDKVLTVKIMMNDSLPYSHLFEILEKDNFFPKKDNGVWGFDDTGYIPKTKTNIGKADEKIGSDTILLKHYPNIQSWENRYKGLRKVLALDVGTNESGYVIMGYMDTPDDDLHLLEFGKTKNEKLLDIVKNSDYTEMVYEQFQCYGMAVGESTIESIIWNGRFIQAALDKEKPVSPIYRKDEKMTLCHTMRAKDSNIRQALIDRYAKTDKKYGKGTKKEPDVFYGVTRDTWQAIAVGVTYCELKYNNKDL